MVPTPLSEKISSTKDVEEGTGEFLDMTLIDNKSSTEYVEKGTDELADMKQAVVTIRRKCLDQFEGQSKGSKG